MKNSFLPILTIIVFSLMVSIPLLKPGLHTMHDDQQVARLFLFDQALKTGQFPVRWVNELGFGFGYPLFVFYPPLVYAMGELFHLIGTGFIDSIKLVFFTSILLSGITMFVLSRKLYGNLAGLVGAIFYIYVPYRALDVYVRGALAESFALVWPPLITWATLRIFQKPNVNNSIILALTMCGLMLTHNLIFLPFALILLPTNVFFFVLSINKKKYLVYSFLAAVICLFLTSFFWLPAIIEKKFTIVDNLLIVNLADYTEHFVHPKQLWNWTWGFGGSTQGLADGISFKIGKLHIIVTFLSFIFSIIFFYSKNNRPSRIRSQKIKLALLFFALFIFSAFMTTQHSHFIWSIFKPLAYLQFPWRFLTFTALFSSIMAATLVDSLKAPVLKLMTLVILLVTLVLPNHKLFNPQYYRESQTDEDLTSAEILNWEVSQSSFEYSPKGIDLVTNYLGANSVNITREEIPVSKMIVDESLAHITITENKPHKIKFTANVKDTVTVRANVFDFPGWELKIDGEIMSYNSNNKFKLITFNLDKGDHTGVLHFKNTPLRNLANVISAISFLILIVYLSKQWLILKHK